MMEDTKKELNKMMENAKEQIALEKESFQKEAKDVSLEISKKVLQTILEDLFDKKEQDILMKKSVQKLKDVQ
jgi:F0F1-type ATP synthase membrane subunit b/b'